ncbi:MAG: GAF domain-containing protein, partial [Verrucomicrobiota bacterium]|nr:GAF domain-containing protein [Verrucomicrobiota bacterium]
QHVHDMVEDLGSTPATEPSAAEKPAEAPEPVAAPTCSVLTLPARAYRDELAGTMLTQLLQQQGFPAENARAALSTDELIELTKKNEWEAICISVVAPSTHTHARFICTRVRAARPHAKIVVGFWGGTENQETTERLRASGADEVVVSLAQAVAQLANFCVVIDDEMIPAPIPANEEERLSTLRTLEFLNTMPEEKFDRMTDKVARIFDVPIALITVIDREQQLIKAGAGLPEDIAKHRTIPRSESICGHIIASDQALTVEDIARDRRFANNAMLRDRGLRFYAGVPLRVNEHAIGSLCILDIKPRRLTEREQRLLEIMADDVVEEIKRRADGTSVAAAAA